MPKKIGNYHQQSNVYIIGMLKRIENKLDDLLSDKYNSDPDREKNWDKKKTYCAVKVINNRPCHFIDGMGWIDDETGFKVQ